MTSSFTDAWAGPRCDGRGHPELRVRYAVDSTGMTMATHIAGDSVTVHLEPIHLERSVIVREW